MLENTYARANARANSMAAQRLAKFVSFAFGSNRCASTEPRYKPATSGCCGPTNNVQSCVYAAPEQPLCKSWKLYPKNNDFLRQDDLKFFQITKPHCL